MKIGRIFFIILFFILLSFVILVGGSLPYFIFYVMIFSILIPLIHLILSLRNIKGYINLPQTTVYKDDHIEINYRVDNDGFFSIPYLEIDNLVSKKLQRKNSKNTIISLDKYDSFSKIEKIHLNRRGFYQIAAIKVIIRDVFGLYSFKKTISSPSSLLVYPRPIDINNFTGILSQETGGFAVKKSSPKDTSNIQSFREYVPGDTMKSIHWKLSGKFDNLIVKEYENSADTNILILLDNSKEALYNDIDRKIEDKSVDIALSIVNYCLRENIQIILNTQYKKDTITLEGKEQVDLKLFLEMFAKLEGNGQYDFNLFMQSQIAHLTRNTTLILISCVLDKEIGARLLDLNLQGINIIFILLTDKANKLKKINLNIEKRLSQEGIQTYIIDYKTSIKEVLEAQNE